MCFSVALAEICVANAMSVNRTQYIYYLFIHTSLSMWKWYNRALIVHVLVYRVDALLFSFSIELFLCFSFFFNNIIIYMRIHRSSTNFNWTGWILSMYTVVSCEAPCVLDISFRFSVFLTNQFTAARNRVYYSSSHFVQLHCCVCTIFLHCCTKSLFYYSIGSTMNWTSLVNSLLESFRTLITSFEWWMNQNKNRLPFEQLIILRKV